MADGQVKSIFEKAARTTGKAAIWTVAAVAGVWILAKAGEIEAEKEVQRPPVIAKFGGDDDTYTAPFTTNGPWQIYWEGDLEIEIWVQRPDETPVKHAYASGWGRGSAFFPEEGTFFLVIRLLQPGSWSITVRSR
jgi:hypothetical protein